MFAEMDSALITGRSSGLDGLDTLDGDYLHQNEDTATRKRQRVRVYSYLSHIYIHT